eukprot:1161656-Pelagomonas_calceolata.AAC.2
MGNRWVTVFLASGLIIFQKAAGHDEFGGAAQPPGVCGSSSYCMQGSTWCADRVTGLNVVKVCDEMWVWGSQNFKVQACKHLFPFAPSEVSPPGALLVIHAGHPSCSTCS